MGRKKDASFETCWRRAKRLHGRRSVLLWVQNGVVTAYREDAEWVSQALGLLISRLTSRTTMGEKQASFPVAVLDRNLKLLEAALPKLRIKVLYEQIERVRGAAGTGRPADPRFLPTEKEIAELCRKIRTGELRVDQACLFASTEH